MIKELLLLADNLDTLGRKNAASKVDGIISLAIRDFQMTGPSKPHPQTSGLTIKGTQALLDLLGLIPVYGEAADLANAAIYLAQGITAQNLTMAALSITSMVPTLGDTIKVIKYGSKLAPEVVKKIAQMIFNSSGAIKSVFDKLKDPKYLQNIKGFIPNGELLVKYSDRMWESLRAWIHNILNYKVKNELGTQIVES